MNPSKKILLKISELKEGEIIDRSMIKTVMGEIDTKKKQWNYYTNHYILINQTKTVNLNPSELEVRLNETLDLFPYESGQRFLYRPNDGITTIGFIRVRENTGHVTLKKIFNVDDALLTQLRGYDIEKELIIELNHIIHIFPIPYGFHLDTMTHQQITPDSRWGTFTQNEGWYFKNQ